MVNWAISSLPISSPRVQGVACSPLGDHCGELRTQGLRHERLHLYDEMTKSGRKLAIAQMYFFAGSGAEQSGISLSISLMLVELTADAKASNCEVKVSRSLVVKSLLPHCLATPPPPGPQLSLLFSPPPAPACTRGSFAERRGSGRLVHHRQRALLSACPAMADRPERCQRRYGAHKNLGRAG